MNEVKYCSLPGFVDLPIFLLFFTQLSLYGFSFFFVIWLLFAPRFRVITQILFLVQLRWCYFWELTDLKWRVPKHAKVLKTKKWSIFFSVDLFGFVLFFDSSSHCVSLTSPHLLFFLLCLFMIFLVINELTLHILLRF